MAWCELNLTGSSLAQAVGGLVRGVAEKDLAAAAALVAALEPSSARTEAAVAISRKLFPDEFQRKPIKPESIAWLAGLDSESARRVMNEIQWQWSMTDPKGMADFLASSPERFPTQAYDTLARELARKSPLDALAWADRLPEERALAAGGEAFAEWRRTQPEAATKWLDALPSSDARRQPYLERSIRVLAWDAQTATQLASLSAADRATARSVIQSMQLPEDRRVSLLELLKSP
jgi:hypothetical protein